MYKGRYISKSRGTKRKATRHKDAPTPPRVKTQHLAPLLARLDALEAQVQALLAQQSTPNTPQPLQVPLGSLTTPLEDELLPPFKFPPLADDLLSLTWDSPALQPQSQPGLPAPLEIIPSAGALGAI